MHVAGPPQRADFVEVQPRRREQIVPVVVLDREHLPDEREPVRVHACGCQADDGVTRLHGRAVDHPVALDDADAGRGEVELALAIDVGHLRLAADGTVSRAAHLGGAVDQLGDLVEVEPVRRHAVQEQRLGAGHRVVDAVPAMSAPQLRSSRPRATIGFVPISPSGGEQSAVVQWKVNEGSDRRHPSIRLPPGRPTTAPAVASGPAAS
jgi:hypothetical protein